MYTVAQRIGVVRSLSLLTTIGSTATTPRKANLVGTASAASEGTIDQQQIATRPILRPSDVLEAIPGLVISQHSGEGKAYGFAYGLQLFSNFEYFRSDATDFYT